MDANDAFDEVQKIARSSKNLVDLWSMKARARATIDQFQMAMSRMPPAEAQRETRVLRQYFKGACGTRWVDEAETPIFMEARDRLVGKV